MRLFSLLLIFNLLFLTDVFAQNQEPSCPWKTGSDLFSIDLNKGTQRELSQTQVIEDLLCLKLLLQNYYIAQKFYPEINLIERIDQKILSARAMTNLKLLEDIFSIHFGIYDTHLRYRLTGNLKSFNPKNVKSVNLKQELPVDIIHDLSKFVYYRPAPLLGELSAGQQSFINFIKNNDRNIVLDLRQLGGGDDVFAFALAKTLFTKSQKVPAVTKLQVESPLKDIGLVNLIKLLKYRGFEQHYQVTKERYEKSPIADLLPYAIEQKTEIISGERPNPYKSKIALIIDSGCRSSCETIVEKLSGLENVKFYGANTGGALLYSNAMTFELPHSRILTSLPTLAHVYEYAAPEGEGYTPHFSMDSIDLDHFEF